LPLTLVQRRTYSCEVRWPKQFGPLMDYYVAAEVKAGGSSKTLTCPPEAPGRFYTVTLL